SRRHLDVADHQVWHEDRAVRDHHLRAVRQVDDEVAPVDVDVGELDAGGQVDDVLACGGGSNLADVDGQGCRGVRAGCVRERVVEDVPNTVRGTWIADVIEVALRIHCQHA